jgi:hypothetical protein
MFALTTTQFTGVRVVSKTTAPKKSVNAVVSVRKKKRESLSKAF